MWRDGEYDEEGFQMFREMRRKKQALSEQRTADIMRTGTSGVLALAEDGGYPYAVPISYVYDDNNEKIYFHCAKAGHKLELIQKNAKASFCVVDQDQVVPEMYTSYFRSAIAFWEIRVLTEEQEKRTAIEKLALKYAPDDTGERRRKTISQAWSRLCMLEMTILHMTGKEAMELIKEEE